MIEVEVQLANLWYQVACQASGYSSRKFTYWVNDGSRPEPLNTLASAENDMKRSSLNDQPKEIKGSITVKLFCEMPV